MVARLTLIFCLWLSYAQAQFPISPNKLDENGKRIGFWTILIDSTFQKEVTHPDSARYYRLLRYENGKPVGKVRDFYRTRQKQWEGSMLSMFPDVADGEATAYHENGKVKYRMNYKAGKANGLYQEYSINGNLLSEGLMQNDSAVGKWNYYEENGFRWGEVLFINTRNNIVTEFYPSGKIKSIIPRIIGERHGIVKTYYENGTLQTICEYVNGKKQGKWEWYNTSGQIEEVGQHHQDNKIGHWKVWYDGAQSLMQEGDYDSTGSVTGHWTYYHPNGKIKSEGQMVAGGNEGMWRFYFDTGGLDTEATLHRGLYDGERRQYYRSGKLKDVAMMKNDTIDGYFIGYYENGNKQAEGKKIKDKKDSVWLYYFENGKVDALETLHLGQLNGRVVNYYPSGQVKDESIFKDGNRNGLFTSYFENGKIESTGTYQQGKKEGAWSWYHSNGQLHYTYFYKNGLTEGPFTTYYNNGIKHSVGVWKANELHGPILRYHKNGKRDEVGQYFNGKATGKWEAYDSITGKISQRWSYKNGLYEGKARYYTPEGKLQSISYYLGGKKEDPYFIRDSIYVLVNQKKFKEAFSAVEWMKRVLKRDFSENHSANYLPDYMLSYINNFGDLDMNQALYYVDRALDVFKKTNSLYSNNYYSTLNDKGLILSSLKRVDEELVIQDTLIQYALNKNNLTALNVYLFNRAASLYRANRQSDIDPMFEAEAKRQASNSPLHENVINVRLKQAEFYYEWSNDRAKSATLYAQIYADLHQQDQTDKRLMDIARQAAYSNNYLANRPLTVHWLKKVIAHSADHGRENENEVLQNMDLLANNYTNLLYLDSAVMYYNKMLAGIESRKLQNSILHARYLDGMAEIYFKKYDDVKAEELWRQAKEMLESQNNTDVSVYGDVLAAHGLVLNKLDRFEEAEKSYLAGLAISKKIDGENHRRYLDAVNSMASIYEDNSKYEKAEEYYNLCLKIIGDTPQQKHILTYVSALNGLADVRRDLGKYSEAIGLNEKAAKVFEPYKQIELTTYADILSDMALDYRRLDDFENAEKYVRMAIAEVEKFYGKESAIYVDYQSALANYYNYRSIYSEAVPLYKSVIAGFEKYYGKNSNRYSSAIRNLASSYKDQGENILAKQYYTEFQALSLRLEGEHSYNYLDATYELAIILWRLDDAESESLHKKCITLGRALFGDNHPSYAFYLKELASYYYYQSRLGEAEELISRAAEIIRASDYGPMSKVYSRYLSIYGDVLSARNKNKEAEEVYLQAVNINAQNKVDFHYDYVSCLENLSKFYEKMGQYNAAEKILTEVIQLAEQKSGKDYTYAAKSANLIALYYSQEKYEQAIALGTQMLDYFESELARDHYLVLEIHNLIGLAQLELEQFDEASSNFTYCLKMLEETKRTQQASYATYQNNLSLVTLAKGDFQTTEKLLTQSADLRKKLGVVLDPVSNAALTDNFAALYQAWGKLDKAEGYWMNVTNSLLRHAQDNFYFMSDEEKAQFWKKIKKDFEYFNTFAVLRSQQNPAILGEMYNNQLATKAILLSASNKIKKRIFSSGDTAMINDFYDWTETRERLAQLYTSSEDELRVNRAKIDSLEIAAKNIEKELNITAEDIQQDRGGQNSLTKWRDVQRLLGADEAAVEIIRFRNFDRYLRDSVVYAALILTAETRTNPKLVLLPNGNFLESRAIRYYKNAIAAKLEDELSYQNFWLPIQNALINKKRVYLSLDGVFNQINLNTLRDESGKFLVEDKNFTIVSNTKDLLALKSRRARKAQSTTAALFGYPKYFIGKDRIKAKINQQRDIDVDQLDDRDGSGIAELPGTEKEIEEVKTILTKNHWQTQYFMNDDATEHALKTIDYPRVLHIATHGFFIDEQESGGMRLGAATEYARQNPLLRSGLLLSGAANFIQNNFRLEEENGILTAYEATNLNLDNTDLVVLSACETGKGEVQNGEGVYGLQRAFQTAGAQAIIMSLWKVDDEATQELMTAFYQNWMSGKAKADAFRQAQLQLKLKYQHPYYWGAFVMMGN